MFIRHYTKYTSPFAFLVATVSADFVNTGTTPDLICDKNIIKPHEVYHQNDRKYKICSKVSFKYQNGEELTGVLLTSSDTQARIAVGNSVYEGSWSDVNYLPPGYAFRVPKRNQHNNINFFQVYKPYSGATQNIIFDPETKLDVQDFQKRGQDYIITQAVIDKTKELDNRRIKFDNTPWSDNSEFIIQDKDFDPEEFVNSLEQHEKSVVLKARDDVVAEIRFKFDCQEVHLQCDVYIDTMSIKPEHRGGGLGSLFYNQFEKFIKSNIPANHSIKLAGEALGPGALKFWKARGFHVEQNFEAQPHTFYRTLDTDDIKTCEDLKKVKVVYRPQSDRRNVATDPKYKVLMKQHGEGYKLKVQGDNFKKIFTCGIPTSEHKNNDSDLDFRLPRSADDKIRKWGFYVPHVGPPRLDTSHLLEPTEGMEDLAEENFMYKWDARQYWQTWKFPHKLPKIEKVLAPRRSTQVDEISKSLNTQMKPPLMATVSKPKPVSRGLRPSSPEPSISTELFNLDDLLISSDADSGQVLQEIEPVGIRSEHAAASDDCFDFGAGFSPFGF